MEIDRYSYSTRAAIVPADRVRALDMTDSGEHAAAPWPIPAWITREGVINFLVGLAIAFGAGCVLLGMIWGTGALINLLAVP